MSQTQTDFRAQPEHKWTADIRGSLAQLNKSPGKNLYEQAWTGYNKLSLSSSQAWATCLYAEPSPSNLILSLTRHVCIPDIAHARWSLTLSVNGGASVRFRQKQTCNQRMKCQHVMSAKKIQSLDPLNDFSKKCISCLQWSKSYVFINWWY